MDTLIVWRISDGRHGHDSQSSGLAAALSRHTGCHTFDIQAMPGSAALVSWVYGIFPPGTDLPRPDLIIGAGHGTHATLLAARRAHGGVCAVLMRPTLPACFFDLCLVPEHDGLQENGRIITTCGPLNSIQDRGRHDADSGLMLIGGPSRHFEWKMSGLLEQMESLLSGTSQSWTVADSPRTPARDRRSLAALPGVNYVPWESVERAWLPEQLCRAGVTWVTCDSVSMIFEALTSGTAVGVLELPPLRASRVTHAVTALVTRGVVTTHANWARGVQPVPVNPPLQEADRCARLILQRLRPGQGP